jgi:hypothetical protein
LGDVTNGFIPINCKSPPKNGLKRVTRYTLD